MPPRKSDAAKVVTGDEGTPAKDSQREAINIEDLNLPKSIVTRLAKGVLPPNTQIQGNAMLAMTKSATVFVNYLASHANEYAQRENRKTLAPQDVFRALEDLEFPDFKARLEAELAKFTDIQTEKRNTYRNKVAANKASGRANSPIGGDGGTVDGESQVNGDGQPAAKKARRDPNDMETGVTLDSRKVDDNTADEAEEDDEQAAEADDDIEDDDDTEGDDDQKMDEEEVEDHEVADGEDDEALDNGEDSE